MDDLTGDRAAISARIDRHGLIAAECAALTGGTPDGDGVADCVTVDLIERAAYVKQGLTVIARAPTFAELVEKIAALDVDADRFRIDVHDVAGRIDRTGTDTAIAIADVLAHDPDLAHPVHRFVVVARARELLFGEVVTETDAAYRVHDTKPWTTSSSLDARFARGLVNLVPEARSLLDPCCGAGSILLEAASLGVDTYGTDWKPAMVGMTRENLAHFGYDAEVELADSRSSLRRVDAIVTDLPYGHAIEADESNVRGIIERCRELAPTAVFVAPTDITDWLRAVGYVDIERSTVLKRRGFTRSIHVARLSDATP